MAVTPLAVREEAERKRSTLKGRYFPTPEEREAFQFVEERSTEWRSQKRSLEKQWFINIAFLAGYHYHYWSDYYGGLVYKTDVPKWRIRQPFNKILEYVETRHSTFMTVNPEMKVRPKTAENDDIRAANLGDKLIRHYWEANEIDMLKHNFVRWLVTTGTAFLKTTWDGGSGDEVTVPVINPDTGKPRLDEDGNYIVESFRQGDLRTEIVSPFNILVPNVERWADVEVLIEEDEVPRAWVQRHYPDKAPYVSDGKSPSLDEASRHYKRTLLNLIGPSGFNHGVEETSRLESCVSRKVLWMKGGQGHPDFPKGRKIVVCGGVVCENDENPYGDLPYTCAVDIQIPGRFWGQSIIDHLIPEQRVFNRTLGKFLECLIIHGQPKTLCPTTAAVPESALTSEPGERVDYSGPQPPTYLPPPPFAESAYRFLLETLERVMDHTSVSFSASRGMATQRLSGIALAQLIEQDVRDMTPSSQRLADAFRRWAVQTLKLAHEMVEEPRMLRLMGRDKRWEISEWMGADLRGHSDVYVDPSSATPKNKALALQWAKELVGSGLKNPMDPADRAWLHQFLEIEDTSLGFDTSQVDERRAKQEIEAARKGFPLPMPLWHENHIIHVSLHREALQSDSFRDNPQIMAVLDQHLQAHYMYMQAMAPKQSSEERGESGGSDGGGRDDRTTNPRGAVPGASPAPNPAGPMPSGFGDQVARGMESDMGL